MAVRFAHICIKATLHIGFLTLLQFGKAGNAYNVGSDEAVSIADAAHLVRDILAPEKKVHINGAALADNADRNRYVPDISKPN